MDEDDCVGGTFIHNIGLEQRRIPLIKKIYRLYIGTDSKGERDVCKRKLEKFGFSFPYYTENGYNMWDIMKFNK
jgi:hypothetical protein